MTSSSTPGIRAAKQPRSPLAGPYGHPFHPILVTVPIGAWVASIVFDIASKLIDGHDEAMLAEASYWLIGLGVIGALLAAVFGLLDLSTLPRGTRAFTAAIMHMGLNLGVVALFIIDFFLRRANDHDTVRTLHLVISLVALAALGAAGWLGGKLAYRYGVRVADEATQAEGFR